MALETVMKAMEGGRRASVIEDMMFTADGDLKPALRRAPAPRRSAMPRPMPPTERFALPAGWPSEPTAIQWSPGGRVTGMVLRRKRDGRAAVIYSLTGSLDAEGGQADFDRTGPGTDDTSAAPQWGRAVSFLLTPK